MVRPNVIAFVSAALLTIVSPIASAQQASGIAGSVRDTSGAVLPGVTVEAASPVLIEKVRTVVTDSEGRYNIVDLRPGAYVVTFSLPSFTTVKREGVELTAGFTATVNAELTLGALEETITVSGATPLVDTRNVLQQKVVSDELLDALPTGSKSVANLIALTPGMTGTADVGGASGIYTSNSPRFNTFHGKGGVKFTYDSLQVNNLGANSATSYIINPSTVEETAAEVGGVSAESAASGIAMNMVPKEGGNAFRYSVSGAYTNDSLQSDNLTDELRARGLTTVNSVLRLYDFNATAGGPIMRDRLWFFAAGRFLGNQNQVAGVFFNRTQGTPVYTPDLERPSYRKEDLQSAGVRLTWQAAAKHKVSGFADPQHYLVRGRGNFTSPESGVGFNFWPQGLYQATWNSPVTSRLLLEAGVSYMRGPYPFPSPGDGFMRVNPNDISIRELSTGFVYNAVPSYSFVLDNDRYVERFSVSYVTGSHSFKAGVHIQQGVANRGTEIHGDVNYAFLRGVPNQVTQFATPYLQKERLMPDLGLFAQDQWSIRRLTVNYGLRFDYLRAYVPDQQVAEGRFVGARQFDEVDCVPCWQDVNPRLGASYDLSGDGRTAVKFSIGRYVGVTATNLALLNNPITTSVNSVSRQWDDTNQNYIPDCDLRNPAVNGECAQISNLNFGQSSITTRYADDVLNGFGGRDHLWDLSTEFQHQVYPGVSVTAGYYRNWSTLFNSVSGTTDAYATDNLEVTPADYSPYCITAPLDPRLPGGGGYPVCGLYDVAPAKFGRVNNLVKQPSEFGDPSRVSDFFNVSTNARLGSALQFGGGIDWGRTVTDRCFVVDSPQQLLNCRVETPFSAQTQAKLYATYSLPHGVIVSGTFQNVPGIEITANYPAPNDQIAPSLGRNLAACGTREVCTATATVPLIAPMTMFEPRRSQVDLRVSKRFELGQRMRLQANVDIYNALNDSSVLGVNSTYGQQWLLPIVVVSGTESILQGRLMQISGQLTF
jgi:hypothetical protein